MKPKIGLSYYLKKDARNSQPHSPALAHIIHTLQAKAKALAGQGQARRAYVLWAAQTKEKEGRRRRGPGEKGGRLLRTYLQWTIIGVSIPTTISIEMPNTASLLFETLEPSN
jgi:hypothetical protein